MKVRCAAGFALVLTEYCFPLWIMSLQRSTVLGEHLGSGRSPSHCPAGESSHSWNIINRNCLTHRSNSAPAEPLHAHERRALARRTILSQNLTWFSRSSCSAPVNRSVSRVHSLPDPERITSSGILLAHVQQECPCLLRTTVPYLRSVSEPGTNATLPSMRLRREQYSLPLSGILMSMSQRISKMLMARDEVSTPVMKESGRLLLFLVLEDWINNHILRLYVMIPLNK